MAFEDPRTAMTRRFLEQTGIKRSMRILDVGCGLGSVSVLLADLTGESGSVVAVDREPKMVASASERLKELGLSNVRVVEGGFADPSQTLGVFDAAVARRVLMYQPDPIEAVRHLCSRVKPGGTIFFEEMDSTVPAKSIAPLPLHVQAREWIWRTLERIETNMHMGLSLYSVFEAVGLESIEVRAEAVVRTPTSPDDTADIIKFLLPRILAQGVATEDEVQIDTLDERLRRERTEAGATYVSELAYAAWGTTSPPSGTP